MDQRLAHTPDGERLCYPKGQARKLRSCSRRPLYNETKKERKGVACYSVQELRLTRTTSNSQSCGCRTLDPSEVRTQQENIKLSSFEMV